MATRAQIDAQFDHVVQTVQGLPATGPVQTSYEDKLVMYGLYKQARVGNVQGSRPGMWDMLKRAKWDAWAKYKDVDSYEAKVLYVDAFVKVLRKYSDKTMARDLIQEIESFIPAFSRSRSGSQSSGSSGSSVMSLRRNRAPSRPTEEIDYPTTDDDDVSGSEDEEEGHDPDAEAVQEAIDTPQPLVQLLRPQTAPTQRSHSSLSSRYRTPGPQASSSFATPGPFLPTQPQMGYAAPSAFSASPPPSRTRPLSLDPAPTHPAWDRSSARAFSPVMPLAQRPLGPVYDTPSGARTSPLEGAVQALQAHMAAMQERIDVLEHMLLSRAGPGASPALSPPWVGSRNLDHDTNSRRSVIFDANDLGLWSLVARPTSALVKLFVFILRVILSPRLASSQPPSPVLLILRRLALDASFVLMALWAAKRGWRASGARRKDVRAALGMLAHAVIGSERTPRQLADKGV